MTEEYHERIRRDGSYYQHTYDLPDYERRYPELMSVIETYFVKKNMKIGRMLTIVRAKLWKLKEEKAKSPRGWRTKQAFIKNRIAFHMNTLERPRRTYTTEEWNRLVWDKAKLDWNQHLEELDFHEAYAKAAPEERLKMYAYKKNIHIYTNTSTTSENTNRGGIPDELKPLFESATMPTDNETERLVRHLIMDAGKDHFVNVMHPVLRQKYNTQQNDALESSLNRMWEMLTPEHRQLFQEGITPNQETLLSILIHTFV